MSLIKKILLMLALVVALVAFSHVAIASASTTTVSATAEATLALTLNTNSVDFGSINPLTPNTVVPSAITVTIDSSSTYQVYILGQDDFAGGPGHTMTIDHLLVKENSSGSYSSVSKTIPAIICDNQPGVNGAVYHVDFELNSDWSVVPDSYTAVVDLYATAI